MSSSLHSGSYTQVFNCLYFVAELVFGSSLSLSHDCFQYLSSNVKFIITRLIQESLVIALRSRRTQLLIADFWVVFKYRNIEPLFGYCCSSTSNNLASFQLARQGARTLYVASDQSVDIRTVNQTVIQYYHQEQKPFNSNRHEKMSFTSSGNILLHVEWLAIDGKQVYKNSVNSIIPHKNLTDPEQQLYFSFIQSNSLNNEFWQILNDNQAALNTVLTPLTEWCRANIYECLLRHRLERKRQRLIHFLNIFSCLLENSSTVINQYLTMWLPIAMTCILFTFETNESYNDEPIENSNIWLIRQTASQTCLKIIKRSTSLVYDVLYKQILSHLVSSLLNSRTSPSSIYAILQIFEQLGQRVCHVFLRPYLSQINPNKIAVSKSIADIMKRISLSLTNE